jgi:hypothetical protein
MDERHQLVLLRAAACAANALCSVDVLFTVTGGCAVTARGGLESSPDVDVLLRQSDVLAAVSALVSVGTRAAVARLDRLVKSTTATFSWTTCFVPMSVR